MSTLPFPAVEPDTGAEMTRQSLSRRLGSRLRGAARGRASYALLDQGVYSFGNMVIAALLSRHSSAAEFGIYILTQRALDVLIQLSNVFLWAPYTFHLPGLHGEDRTRYQGSVVFLQGVLLLLFMGALFTASALTSGGQHVSLHATFSPLVIACVAILFREFTRRLYFAHLRLKEAFWTELATVTFQIAGVAYLVRTQQVNVPRTLCVLSWAAGLVSLWWVVRDWSAWQVSPQSVAADFKRDLRLSRWFFGSNMIFLASSQCNPWVLSAALGGSAVGSYAVAESLVNIPRVALTSMQNMMGPVLARAQAEGGKPSVRAAVKGWNRQLLVFSSVFALLICSFGPQVAQLIYHRVNVDTRRIAFWLAINLVVYACTMAQSYGLTAVGRADTTLYVNAVGLAVQAAVCFGLIRFFHVPGAAMALLLGSISVLLLRQWVYSREMAATA